MRHNNRLQLTALFAALASAYPLQTFANAGVTQFSVGDVSVQRSASSVPLTNGSRIESGDLITTGNTGRTQLRFTDGGMVSLQPNSQFKISRYTDSGNAQQDSFLVDLARGGMRALTGLIGKRNRDNYKVTTTTATIGIRGSGFSMAYNSDGSLSVTTEQDAIDVCTQGGCIGLNMGESALVTSAGALPRRVEKRAVWNPPNPRRSVGARNDDVDSEGKTKTIPRQSQVFTNLAFTSAGLRSEESADIRGYLEGAALVQDGVLIGYRARNNDQGDSGTVTELARSGSVEGGDFMLLGTWQNANWSGSNPATVAQSAFVIGQPAMQAAVTNLAGMRAQYNLTAGAPVFSSVGNGTLLSSSHVIVDFRQTFGNLDINLNVSLPPINNENENLVGQSLPIYGGSDGLYNLRGSATATAAGFNGVLGITGSTTGYHEGSGNASGFFGGPQAGSLGLSFTGNTPAHGLLAGAGIFNRNGDTSIPVASIANNSYALHVLDGSNEYNFSCCNSTYNQNIFSLGEGAATFSGTQLTNWSDDNITLSQTAPRLYGSIGQPGETNFLGWGSWAAGNLAYDGDTALSNVHYVVGKPTSMMPYSGSASYNLIGGTVPTSTLGGNGQLLSTSNLAVNFGSQSITANINLLFGSTDASFSTTGIISGSSFRSAGCSNTYFSGFFSGPNAMRAGLVYGSNHSTLGNIRGAAAFQSSTVLSQIP